MKWIGLTGGIATGKTTVAEMLRKNGYPVVDADAIAREVVARGTPGFKKIVDKFGRFYVQADGDIDRKRLGQAVFDDPLKRQDLEHITHPLIQEKVRQIRAALEAKGHAIAFYDVPLLYEKNLEPQFDSVVVVACSAPTQLDRLIKRNKLSRGAAASRVASQIPILDKVGKANFVIWNDGAQKDLDFEFAEFLKKLKAAV